MGSQIKIYINKDKNPLTLRKEAAGRKLKKAVTDVCAVTTYFNNGDGMLTKDYKPIALLDFSDPNYRPELEIKLHPAPVGTCCPDPR